MNAVSTDFIEESGNGSDSDTNLDESPEYYQPILAVDDEDSDQLSSDEDHAAGFHHLPNGISSLEINDGVEREEDEGDEEGENENEEEEIREIPDSATVRAFSEDESRRNAPLSPENATRVMEAMRGVSFGGVAPDWVGLVPEDQWIDRLRRLRQPPQTSSSSTIQN
ncbi:uncharacterized protein LOC112000443 [Quercus suber]|uniref:Uncharacterized protein n=1 Tax=Quercus suber TaxID=58331 RepID=A0AAW0KT16_QUESU|nr:uncharacterized protein LOC112000443 [Quercus suber]POE66338.1 hypothetical protein CFP56_15062 [Quercus suber]